MNKRGKAMETELDAISMVAAIISDKETEMMRLFMAAALEGVEKKEDKPDGESHPA